MTLAVKHHYRTIDFSINGALMRGFRYFYPSYELDLPPTAAH